MEKFVALAKQLGMKNAASLTPEQVFFDPRAVLKCRWGCEDYNLHSPKCQMRETTFEQRREMVAAYGHILLVHSHDAHMLSKALLELERQAFLDGHYFAFAIRYCRWCPKCQADEGKPCAFPQKIRPCDQAFGIDVYRTAREAGLPIRVLQSQDEAQNRYGFLLIQ